MLTDDLPTTDEQPGHLSWIDRVGAALAGICAIHCFFFMLGSVVFGLTASSHLISAGLGWTMVFLLACLSIGSLWAHGSCYQQTPAWLMVAGLTAITTAKLLGIWTLAGEMLSLFGGLVLASGHLIHLSKAKHLQWLEKLFSTCNPPRKVPYLLLVCIGGIALFQLVSVSGISSSLGLASRGALAGEQLVGWRVLAQLDIQTGDIGPDLREVVGNRVAIPGFVVPLEPTGRTFLLAPHAGACIHGPTPPGNQIVFVTMEDQAVTIDPWSWDPIWVVGTLRVMDVHSPFGSAGFKMNGISTERYQ